VYNSRGVGHVFLWNSSSWDVQVSAFGLQWKSCLVQLGARMCVFVYDSWRVGHVFLWNPNSWDMQVGTTT
jgi:hypothetical protein